MLSKLFYNNFMSTPALSLVVNLIFGSAGKFIFHFVKKSELLLLKALRQVSLRAAISPLSVKNIS